MAQVCGQDDDSKELQLILKYLKLDNSYKPLSEVFEQDQEVEVE